MSGRPKREEVAGLNATSDEILAAYFDSNETTQTIADRFGISRRSVYRRIDRALSNRRKAARAEALERMEG